MTLLRNILIILLITILFLGHGICQKNKDSVIYFPFISISLAIQSPQGDLANNFGVNSNIGLSLGWKNKKNQTFELNYNFIHSENVKNTSVLDHLINDQGWIINQYGEENLFLMYHRGGLISLDMGKVYNIIGPNPNSGIFLKGGIEAIEGFNRGMRDYQIDLMGPYTENKFDVYLGIRAGWFFPVLRKNPNEFYYN